MIVIPLTAARRAVASWGVRSSVMEPVWSAARGTSVGTASGGTMAIPLRFARVLADVVVGVFLRGEVIRRAFQMGDHVGKFILLRAVNS